jgi:preprotein translocase subunit SecB
MTDQPPADTGAAPQNAPQGAPQGPQMRVLVQYVRDLSFENPRAPDSLRVDGKPGIDMAVELNAKGRQDNLFEVELKLSVGASIEDKAMFQIELVYGGVFQIAGVPEKDMEPFLLIECPRYLFPFAREIISRASADGGFYPPFQLDPLDFAAIYRARQGQAQALNAAPAEGQA